MVSMTGEKVSEVAADQPIQEKRSIVGRRGGNILEELNQADSAEAKLIALGRLQEMDLKGLHREIEKMTVYELRGVLSFGVKAMILRLAEINPQAAVDFIREQWIRHEDDDNYVHEVGQAWRLVSAEWAHQDSMEFLEFWKETEKTLNHSLRILKHDLEVILLAGDPRGWMTLAHLTESYYRWDGEEFLSTLRSAQDFKAALDTWNHPPEGALLRWEENMKKAIQQREKNRIRWEQGPELERNPRMAGMSQRIFERESLEIEKERNPRLNGLAQRIIARWRAVDEKGFLESEFVEWASK